ncbi:hypothetical protein ACFQLX_21830 [Streptomyces polyrhachis]|uniref:Secreted protein n=1 Tax=Streptomyces polyrhachis TaxID=1282885 RepID=A0ABW2GJJ7_9ACTN
MNRRYVPLLGWTLATVGVVALSWFSVQVVLSAAVHPRALPAVARYGSAQVAAPGGPAGDARAGRASGTGPAAPRSDLPQPRPERGTKAAQPRPVADGGGEVETYDLPGGRVVLEIAQSCALVSATPAAGWAVESWRGARWIRVDFSRGGSRGSVVCSWHDHAPLVEVDGDAG